MVLNFYRYKPSKFIFIFIFSVLEADSESEPTLTNYQKIPPAEEVKILKRQLMVC